MIEELFEDSSWNADFYDKDQKRYYIKGEIRRVSKKEIYTKKYFNISDRAKTLMREEKLDDYMTLERLHGIYQKPTGICVVEIQDVGKLFRKGIREVLDDSDSGKLIFYKDADSEFSLQYLSGIQLLILASRFPPSVQNSYVQSTLFPEENPERNRFKAKMVVVSIYHKDFKSWKLSKIENYVEKIIFSMTTELRLIGNSDLKPVPWINAYRYTDRQARVNAVEPKNLSDFNLKNTYPVEVSSLMIAASDEGISPVIRFWAYYQILEYYFGRYTKNKIFNDIQNLLKNPNFDVHDANDLRKLRQKLEDASAQMMPDERKQIIALVGELYSSDEIKEFISESKLVDTEYFKINADITKKQIDFSRSDIDEQVALRIYDIRCSIVHSKYENGSNAGIVPGYRYDESVLKELPLIRAVVEKLILTESTPVNIK